MYSHVYSHRVGTSRDEAGRAGTTKSDNARKHSKLLSFAKAVRHLENRWSRKAPVGSNPTPSAFLLGFSLPSLSVVPRSVVLYSQRTANGTG